MKLSKAAEVLQKKLAAQIAKDMGIKDAKISLSIEVENISPFVKTKAKPDDEIKDKAEEETKIKKREAEKKVLERIAKERRGIPPYSVMEIEIAEQMMSDEIARDIEEAEEMLDVLDRSYMIARWNGDGDADEIEEEIERLQQKIEWLKTL